MLMSGGCSILKGLVWYLQESFPCWISQRLYLVRAFILPYERLLAIISQFKFPTPKYLNGLLGGLTLNNPWRWESYLFLNERHVVVDSIWSSSLHLCSLWMATFISLPNFLSVRHFPQFFIFSEFPSLCHSGLV